MSGLIARLRRRPKLWHPERVWDIAAHRGWGDRISWRHFADGKLDGHTRPRPSIGDELRSPMASGRVARFRFVDVDYVRDPPDMWFATVEAVGYLDETPDAPPVTRRSVFS